MLMLLTISTNNISVFQIAATRDTNSIIRGIGIPNICHILGLKSHRNSLTEQNFIDKSSQKNLNRVMGWNPTKTPIQIESGRAGYLVLLIKYI